MVSGWVRSRRNDRSNHRITRRLAASYIDGKTAVKKAEAETKMKIATGEISWEQAAIEASNNSWKDEAWTVAFIAIVFGSFIPGIQPYMAQGFANLDAAPAVVSVGDVCKHCGELWHPHSEGVEKVMATPAKGKARVKVTASGKKVSYGQAGKAKGGGPRVKPGTSKGDAYCARSAAQKKKFPKAAKDPNSPLNLSRKRWKCSGTKSKRS